MEDSDSHIVDLFWERQEKAIAECVQKYGSTCQAVAMSILNNRLDAEECVNDTWIRAWNSIPPQRPDRLGAFLTRIVRNLSLDRLRRNRANRRIPGEYVLSLEELSGSLPDGDAGTQSWEDEETEAMELGGMISDFLRTEPETARKLFVCRYFYNQSIEELCSRFYMGESRVKSTLFRTRNRLKKYLEKEGVQI